MSHRITEAATTSSNEEDLVYATNSVQDTNLGWIAQLSCTRHERGDENLQTQFKRTFEIEVGSISQLLGRVEGR